MEAVSSSIVLLKAEVEATVCNGFEIQAEKETRRTNETTNRHSETGTVKQVGSITATGKD